MNYLRFVDRCTTRYVFLEERMEGMPQAARPGGQGVLSPTKLEHYENGLPQFRMVDMTDSFEITQVGGYQCSFWRRRGKSSRSDVPRADASPSGVCGG